MATNTDEGAVYPAEDFDDISWETVTAGNGEKIEFTEVPFVGRFLGKDEIVGVVNARTGEVENAPIVKFEDRSGDPCFAWASYQLNAALEHVEVGSKVRITHLGTKDIGQGRTINRYRVQVAL